MCSRRPAISQPPAAPITISRFDGKSMTMVSRRMNASDEAKPRPEHGASTSNRHREALSRELGYSEGDRLGLSHALYLHELDGGSDKEISPSITHNTAQKQTSNKVQTETQEKAQQPRQTRAAPRESASPGCRFFPDDASFRSDGQTTTLLAGPGLVHRLMTT
ncbi:unnamed protein product [Heligmosomoides polygyrus]|uniref:Uncharacterized protein n=1 Tax=Heligmosomoides polygyrus TaxID=6339 RepID=A0A183FI98_HELPZ|nr:unnamed protein product [Heligmosomoides polygyrus]